MYCSSVTEGFFSKKLPTKSIFIHFVNSFDLREPSPLKEIPEDGYFLELDSAKKLTI